MRCVDDLVALDQSLAATPGETVEQLVARLAAGLAAHHARPTRVLAFVPAAQRERLFGALGEHFGDLNFPVNQLCGRGPRSESEPWGLQCLAVAGTPVTPLWLDGRPVGSVYHDGQATYVVLGDLYAADRSASEHDQCRAVFDAVNTVLAPRGLDFHHITRTWLFADRILDWYDELNATRHGFFHDHDVFGRRVPASTGVGIGNAVGAAITLDALAVAPDPGASVDLFAVPSPLQCPALDYCSAFARALEMDLPGGRRLTVSGTASIEPGGATVHDTVEEQVAWTMEVVLALLDSRGMSAANICRGLAYYADEAKIGTFERWQAEHGCPEFPLISLQADICRPDLLFEIELDAFA